MTTLKARFDAPAGTLLAITPQALGAEHALFAALPELFTLAANGKAAVVEINGPLAYASAQFDTYAGILARFEAALGAADIVVLKINSPGGEVSGTFDLARYMRARARAVDKTILCYVEAQASSSGYALASCADEIVCSETATLGSIGIIQCMKSEARAAAAAGLDFAVVTSGARKADGNPLLPISPEALAASQSAVDTMAGLFFGLVQEHRGVDSQPFEASSFVGAAAVAAGLANRVMRYDSFIGAIANGTLGARTPEVAPAAQSKSMSDEDKDKPAEDAVRAALVTASTSDDPDKKARAAKALAAYDEDEKEKAAAPVVVKAADEKPFPKDDDKEESKAVAALSAQLSAQAAGFEAFKASIVAEKEETAKAALLASRPDLSAETLKQLAGENLASCKKIVSLIPVTPGFHSQAVELQRAAASGSVSGDRSDPETLDLIKSKMGITQFVAKASYDANTHVQTFGAVAPMKAGS